MVVVGLVELHAWSDFGSYLVFDADWDEYEAQAESGSTSSAVAQMSSAPVIVIRGH